MVHVVLVSYIDVGKSTLMNALAKSGISTESRLFTILDTTVRRVALGNLTFLLADIVDFVRKLPI